MAVYVDDMRAPYGRLIMCHLIADTEAELHAMADQIGVARRWYQNTINPHYDICLSKRRLAVQLGAREITWRQTRVMCRHRRQTGRLCTPEQAQQELEAARERRAARGP